jgi:hypothetical protein
MSTESKLSELRMDPADLYREETFTDRRVGSIRRLVPVGQDGADDHTRPVVFEGQTTLLTPGGRLPLRFGIEADTLAQALERFGAAAESALKETLAELAEIRRQAASPLVVPGSGSLGPPNLGAPGGGSIIRG